MVDGMAEPSIASTSPRAGGVRSWRMTSGSHSAQADPTLNAKKVANGCRGRKVAGTGPVSEGVCGVACVMACSIQKWGTV